MIAVYLTRILTFAATFFVLLPDQFDAFNPKNVSETNAMITPPSISQLEKRTSSNATDAVQHSTLAIMPTTHIPTYSSL